MSGCDVRFGELDQARCRTVLGALLPVWCEAPRRVSRGAEDSKFSPFRKRERILDIDAKVPDRALDLCMTEQDLHST